MLHEYPKRDTPYAEDMGRAATHYQVTGYLVGPNYDQTKRALMAALDSSAGATLMDPYLAMPTTCICERYSVTETRERGGYCVFEMAFVEIGSAGNTLVAPDTGSAVDSAAQSTSNDAAANVNTAAEPEAPGP